MTLHSCNLSVNPLINKYLTLDLKNYQFQTYFVANRRVRYLLNCYLTFCELIKQIFFCHVVITFGCARTQVISRLLLIICTLWSLQWILNLMKEYYLTSFLSVPLFPRGMFASRFFNCRPNRKVNRENECPCPNSNQKHTFHLFGADT